MVAKVNDGLNEADREIFDRMKLEACSGIARAVTYNFRWPVIAPRNLIDAPIEEHVRVVMISSSLQKILAAYKCLSVKLRKLNHFDVENFIAAYIHQLLLKSISLTSFILSIFIATAKKVSFRLSTIDAETETDFPHSCSAHKRVSNVT